MFILFITTDTAVWGLAIKHVSALRHVFINKVTKLPRCCFVLSDEFFVIYVTSFLYDVISLFYTKCHKDTFLMGAIIYCPLPSGFVKHNNFGRFIVVVSDLSIPVSCKKNPAYITLIKCLPFILYLHIYRKSIELKKWLIMLT